MGQTVLVQLECSHEYECVEPGFQGFCIAATEAEAEKPIEVEAEVGVGVEAEAEEPEVGASITMMLNEC